MIELLDYCAFLPGKKAFGAFSALILRFDCLLVSHTNQCTFNHEKPTCSRFFHLASEVTQTASKPKQSQLSTA